MTGTTLRRIAGVVLMTLAAALIMPATAAQAELRYRQFGLQNYRSGFCADLDFNDGAEVRLLIQRLCPSMTFGAYYDPISTTYRLTAAPTARCAAAVAQDGFSWVAIRPCTGDATERWRFVSPGFSSDTLIGQLLNSTRMMQNVGYGTCVSVAEHSTSLYTYLTHEPCNRDHSQLWYLTPRY
jgi:hypothetical protein